MLYLGVKVVVTTDYEALEDDELTLRKGETVIVVEKKDDIWWLGYKDGKLGYFLTGYVQVIT